MIKMFDLMYHIRKLMLNFFPLKRRQRVGILGMTLAYNFGGILQAYALQKKILELGFDVFVIRTDKSLNPYWWSILQRIKHIVSSILWTSGLLPTYPLPFKIIRKHAKKFIMNNIRETYPINLTSFSRDISLYDFDFFVVGSDQVWNEICKPEGVAFYYLDTLSTNDRSKAIAYSASFGKDTWGYNTVLTEKCSMLVREFRAVSVREVSGISLCKDYLLCDALQMPDPTLLLTNDEYNLLIKNSNFHKGGKPYLATYILDWDLDKKTQIDFLAKDLNIEIININEYEEHVIRRKQALPRKIEEWIFLISNARYLITDSFHGCVFSVIYNIAFIALGNQARGMARFETLLETFQLKDRLISISSTSEIRRILKNPIDWERVNAIRDSERERGLNFLKENLK